MSRTAVVLRVLAAAALGVSAYVHIHLAERYPYPGTITGTQLFYAQGAAAALLGLALLLSGNRLIWMAAAALGAASFAAVMLYRYTHLGAVGPLPDMNDMSWQPTPEKPLSAVAELLVPVLWLTDELRRRVSVSEPRPQRTAAASS